MEEDSREDGKRWRERKKTKINKHQYNVYDERLNFQPADCRAFQI